MGTPILSRSSRSASASTSSAAGIDEHPVDRLPCVGLARGLDKRPIHELAPMSVASEERPDVVAVGHVVELGDGPELIQIGDRAECQLSRGMNANVWTSPRLALLRRVAPPRKPLGCQPGH